MVAVLAAVSEEIKSRGGSESNTEYFAALVCYADAVFVLFSCFLTVEHVFVSDPGWRLEPESFTVQGAAKKVIPYCIFQIFKQPLRIF